MRRRGEGSHFLLAPQLDPSSPYAKGRDKRPSTVLIYEDKSNKR